MRLKVLARAPWASVGALVFATLASGQSTAPPSPDWLKSGVIYEINPRTFSASGDFKGIEQRLPDLQHLGATILWLMPIHPPGKLKSKGTLGSPYAVRDYYAIDPAYGQPQDLKRLVDSAHRLGFKVIIDIVANHTSWDSVMMKFPDFYKHNAAGDIIAPEPDWADVAALNYSNPKLREYMVAMLQYWIREFDLDGFRCDVAFGPPVSFWNEARAALDQIKPDIVMLAEAHTPELLQKAFNLDYSWPLHSDLTNVFEFGSAASTLPAEWAEERRIYPTGSLHMRFSDNHDEKRAIARFGERGALAASALMFTLDGVPLLYNGMEVGDTAESGAPALFERLPVFWQIAERRPEFPRFYEQMIRLRRMNPALQQGATTWLNNSEPDRILSYQRAAAGTAFLVVINCSNRPFRGRVETGEAGWSDVTPNAGFPAAKPVAVLKLPEVALEAWGFRVLRASGEQPSPRR